MLCSVLNLNLVWKKSAFVSYCLGTRYLVKIRFVMVFAFVEQQTKERLLNLCNSQTEFDKSYAKHLTITSSHVKCLIMPKTE